MYHFCEGNFWTYTLHLFQATENAGLKAALEEEQRQQSIFSEEINRLKVTERKKTVKKGMSQLTLSLQPLH